ncbi:hypothetical protein E5A73_04385 [Sphingomonas gei]|uniref:Uncharacterized protein n=1 Tax=Sphingomonas gei TaxID=1395960 RepID=A0A4S1XFI4_9SPHN|nr:hypothetical protein [Sphingomonas gei]TGX54705.1 hypothetical protein E5A73_04385 [Sphingomonas gei]
MHPPACALPDAERVAQSCAVHDVTRSPGYRSPSYDEEGEIVAGSPIPAYAVSDLKCGFINSQRNRAICRFKLETPDMPAGPVDTRATLEHNSWQDHGPTHHLFGTLWSATASCLPAAPPR